MSRAATFLLIVGLTQMVADVCGVQSVRAIAMASTVSPAPRVFCTRHGLETFSTKFFLEWEDVCGTAQSLPFTPEVARELEGPYNRRNVYGAIIAYGPVLATEPVTRGMYNQVMRYALGDGSRLLREVRIDPESVRGTARIRLEPIDGTDLGDRPLVLEVPR